MALVPMAVNYRRGPPQWRDNEAVQVLQWLQSLDGVNLRSNGRIFTGLRLRQCGG